MIDQITQLTVAQREFSRETFGPYPRLDGVLDHLREEVAELKSAPHDLEGYADCLLLTIDYMWRSGGAVDDIAPDIANAFNFPGLIDVAPDDLCVLFSTVLQTMRANDVEPASIVLAAFYKLEKNKRRNWPDCRYRSPISRPQAKVLEALDDGNAFAVSHRDGKDWPKCYTFDCPADGVGSTLYVSMSVWSLMRRHIVEVKDGKLVRCK